MSVVLGSLKGLQLDDSDGSQESEQKEDEESIRVILHETPKVFHDYGDQHINVQIEIIVPRTREDLFKVLKESYRTKSDAIFYIMIWMSIKEEIKLTNKNKEIMRNHRDMEICVHYLDPSDPKSEKTFFSLSGFAVLTALNNSKDANYFLKYYRFSPAIYIRCMRAAIRHNNARLLTIILEIQALDRSWENCFPFIQEWPSLKMEDAPLRFLFANDYDQNFNLRQHIQNLGHPAISDSPLSYALRKGANSKIMRILLSYGAHPVLECMGHTIDVSKEIIEMQENERNQKTAFLMAFNARLGQDSAVFHEFRKAEICDVKPLTQTIFKFL